MFIFGKYNTQNNIFQRNKILLCTKKPLFEYGISTYIVPKDKLFKINKPIIEIEENPPFIKNDIIT